MYCLRQLGHSIATCLLSESAFLGAWCLESVLHLGCAILMCGMHCACNCVKLSVLNVVCSCIGMFLATTGFSGDLGGQYH